MVAFSPSVPTLEPRLAEAPRRGVVLAIILRYGLVLVLALAPLPLGSARPLAWSLLALASAGLLGLAISYEIIFRTPTADFAPLRIPMMLGAIVAGWIVIQSVPLGAGIAHSPIWDMAAQAVGASSEPSISVDRWQSLQRLLRLLSYGAIFLVAWRVAREADGAAMMIRAIGLIGTAYALYGMAVYFTGNRSILWLTKWVYTNDLTSTFVNRNSFATFVGLCITASLGLMVQAFARSVDPRSLRTIVQSSIECVFWRGSWVTMILVITGSALLLAHSRGGTAATLLGMVGFVAAIVSAPSLQAPWRRAFAAAALAGTVLIIAVSGSGLLTRFNDSIETDARIDAYGGTLNAIRDNALLGTGLGTFRFVYPPYQSPSDEAYIDFAHNDYLENALELGIPAAIVFYAIPALLVIRCAMGVVRRRRRAVYPCVAVGASVLVGCHSLIDFSMQMPAVAVTYAALLGVGVAQAVGSDGGRAAQQFQPDRAS